MSVNYNFHISYTQPNVTYSEEEATTESASPSQVKLYYLAQPQLIRTRHRFRGQKESYKFNLELGQLRFDSIRLIEKFMNLESTHTTNNSFVYEGGLLQGVKMVDSELATPSTLDVVLEGIESLATRLTKLENTLRVLE